MIGMLLAALLVITPAPGRRPDTVAAAGVPDPD